MKRVIFVVISILILASSLISVPRLMNYQGKLTDTGGVAVNADLDMIFRIYSTETGGTALWTESHTGVNQVSVVKGLFDVELGSITPIDLDFSADYWLELVVDGELLTPREKLSTVGYAFRAAIADSVAGGGSGGSSNWTLSGSNIYNNNSGNVGIGTTTPGYKLHVTANQPSGYGTGLGHFVNTASSDDAAGIYGACANTDYYGFGGFFRGGYIGAYAEISPTGSNYYSALYGYANPSGGGNVSGVYGYVDGHSGQNYGVRGEIFSGHSSGQNTGVRGYVNASGAINYGIYGSAVGGTTNWAGYFSGNVRITGGLFDSSGDVGSSGQILSSNGSGTNWIDPPSGGGSGNWTLSGSYLYPNSTTYDVGIGTTSPSYKLHVNGDAYATQFRLPSNGLIRSDGSWDMQYYLPTGDHYYSWFFGATERFRLHTTGFRPNATGTMDLGHPSYPWSSFYLTGQLYAGGSAGSSGQVLTSGGAGGNVYWSDAGAGSGNWTLSGLNLYPNSTTYNVGIGTTSPSYKLHVQNTGGASSAKIGYSSTYYDNRLFFGDGSYVYIGELNSDDRLYLRGSTMSIDIGDNTGSSGQVLKSNGSTLYWANDETGGGGSPAGTNGAVQFNNSGSFGGNASQFYWDNSNSRLGIGTSSPSAKITVSYAATDIYGIYVTMPGWAIYGDASGGSGRGVMGRGGEYGILGNHLTTDRMGYIGSANYGVYGQYDSNNYAYLGGQVSGNNAGMRANGQWVSGFFGDFNDGSCGQRGIYSIGTIYGLFARDTCGTVTTSDNYAYLGYRETSWPNTQYGILARGNDYAGYFIGKTCFDVGDTVWLTDYSGGEPTLRPHSPDWGYVGTSNYNWWRMYSNTYYGENTSILLFDTYDDLALLHAIEGDTLWDPLLEHHVMQIRPETFPKCITNYEDNSDRLFISVQRTDGLLIGAVRQLDNEAKTRDRRIVERTEILAKAIGANFKGDYSQIKIFDFGSSAVLSGSRWVLFSNDFAEQLNGEIPAITLTAHSPDAGLWIAEKSPHGFLVRSKNPDEMIDFDWSAFAKVEVKTSGDLGDVFRKEKPTVSGSYPIHLPGIKKFE